MLKLTLTQKSPLTVKADAFIAGIQTQADLALEPFKTLNAKNSKTLEALFVAHDFEAAAGETISLRHLKGIQAREVMLVGLGDVFDDEAMRSVFAKALKATRAKKILVSLNSLTPENRSLEWTVMHLAQCAKTLEEPLKAQNVNDAQTREICFVVEKTTQEIKEALALGVATADAVNAAKWLANLPANVCTPTYLTEVARGYKHLDNVTVKIHDQKALKKLGMNALLAVAQGSSEAPYLIEMIYKGAEASEAPVCLVGKGITMDAGGLCLKPARSMTEMKFDMCGAATVMATFEAAARMALPINLVALVPVCENMPDGGAFRLTDVIETMAGITVEITNTDAEGRLVLADALTYAKRHEPEIIVDVATLTGACVVALGDVYSGLFVNDPMLCDALEEASEISGDAVWTLPFNGRYKKMMKSHIAHCVNSNAAAKAGACTAATFLAQFVDEDCAWAHLDVAGTAHTSGAQAHATGRPVPLLVTWLAGLKAQ